MQDEKSKRTRSPAYPYIDLEEAVAKVAVLWKQANRHSVPIDVAAKYWGYDGKSSVTYSVASALLKFGLVTDEGTGEQRQLKLSESAIKLVYEPDTTDPAYIKELRDAALRPKIHSEIWENYGGKLPDDAVIRRFLVLDRKFNDQYVDVFISEFRRTIEFAKLTDAVKVPNKSTDEGFQRSQKDSQKSCETKVQNQSIGQSDKNVLAQYSIPLGASEATLIFTGESLSGEDFDALAEFVLFAKKQHARRLKLTGSKNVIGSIEHTFQKES
ncbi:MAG: hypothetical protein DME24_17320 [Verrucomicrobia bacterium]|nr:MAG: hypothetical protein DME24_17320 [Verrucomicrobiota bacterium]